MLNKLTVKLETSDKIVTGSFRALNTTIMKDIIILGDDKTSALFCLDDVEVLEIEIEEIKELNGQVFSEYHYPKNKQEAYSLLTKLYLEHREGRSIDTELFDTKSGYTFTYKKTVPWTERGNYTPVTTRVYPPPPSSAKWPQQSDENYRDPWQDYDEVQEVKAYITPEPMVSKTEKIKEYLNKVLEGTICKPNNWIRRYSGQL